MTPLGSPPNNLQDSYNEADKIPCKTVQHIKNQEVDDPLMQPRDCKETLLLKKLREMQNEKEPVDGKL